MKENQVSSIKGPDLMGDNKKKCKNGGRVI
jgi:hypothetical protein